MLRHQALAITKEVGPDFVEDFDFDFPDFLRQIEGGARPAEFDSALADGLDGNMLMTIYQAAYQMAGWAADQAGGVAQAIIIQRVVVILEKIDPRILPETREKLAKRIAEAWRRIQPKP